MKILELRFKNLNSLYGEWTIDFTSPDYIANGIFALTGPTGAGKSTILDAVCLALYGATPRLGRITKSGNEIMSRQTGECFAEVLFEAQSGRFRCHWSQHRARKKAAGELQNPRHEIAEGGSEGQLIEHQLRQVQATVEEKTGMDFERFTRSILLAQGGFDTFLRADIEQKSKILEQITGTEIYSEISRRVHERQRDEREALNLLQAETAGILILEPEQEQSIHDELASRQKEETDLSGKATATEKAINWLHTITGLKEEISSLAEDAETLQNENKAFQSDRERLGSAHQAAALEGDYAALTALRRQQSEDQAALKGLQEALPELEASAGREADELRKAEQQTGQAKAELKNAAPLLQQVRALDQRRADRQKTVTELEQSCHKDAQKIAADRQTQRKMQDQHSEAENKLRQAQNYLSEHAQDEWLIGGLAGIEEQLGSLQAKHAEISAQEASRKKAKKKQEQTKEQLNRCRKQTELRRQEQVQAVQKLQQAQARLKELLEGRRLREYRAEKEALLREMALLQKIAALEDYRSQLQDGQPCPLCGAAEHPFARGQVPVPHATEAKVAALEQRIGQAETQETTIRKGEEEVASARSRLTDSEKEEAEAAYAHQAADTALAELNQILDKRRTALGELRQAVADKLQPLGIGAIPEDVSPLLTALRERLRAWQGRVEKKDIIEKQLAERDSELKRLAAVIETECGTLEEKQQQLAALKEEQRAGNQQRHDLYGKQSPDAEERRLNQAVTDAEKAERASQARYSERQQQVNNAKNQIDSLQKSSACREPELNRAESTFADALKPAGFVTEQAFLAARITSQERDRLAARAKQLDDAQTELKARQKDRETRLEKEFARQVTTKNLEQLEPIFQQEQDSLQQLRAAIAGLKHQLSENSRNRERIKEKQAAINAQKAECRRWEKLHGLIGSSDGKKYRTFAQGLTFELMVSHANRQLEKMTDRYLLIRDEGQPLELNVIDNYQAGEIRSTRNLSGGESFIVSLTLALGLSKMASRKVRVDSLFLDEGFGTLDEEALDTALEALSGLQQDGKLIGVISHVPELKERISAQIQVLPQTGGRSVIQGPGVQQR
jgi:exonuclease SbcC